MNKIIDSSIFTLDCLSSFNSSIFQISYGTILIFYSKIFLVNLIFEIIDSIGILLDRLFIIIDLGFFKYNFWIV